MSLQYSHLLISERSGFVPQPVQVAGFLEGLAKLGSAPLGATFRIAKSSGRVRTGSDPMTGEKVSTPVRDFTSLGSVSETKERIAGLDDYDFIISGSGPPKLPPFPLHITTEAGASEFHEAYGYEVRCSLRNKVVSTCEEPPFGSLCGPERRIGKFRHPNTGATIEVQNAACARFWIEFRFGKWLTPKIDCSVNLLHPSIVSNAIEQFGVGFAQGCIYG